MKLFMPFLALAILCQGCGVTEPTYQDIPAEQLEAIAQQFGVQVEDLFTTHRSRLKAELSQELGMKVERIFEDEDLDGKIDALQPEIRSVVAEIEPAFAAAMEAAGGKALVDPTSPASWLSGGVAGGGILLAGLLGLRGRQRRKKEVASG